MIEYFALLIAIPLGFLLAAATRDEKNIYSRIPYFPIMVWILALLGAIFLTLNKTVGLTLAFMFLTTLVWWKA